MTDILSLQWMVWENFTFHANGGSTAMSAVDDMSPTAYGESWDLIGTLNCCNF
jgi:hypothetical protein